MFIGVYIRSGNKPSIQPFLVKDDEQLLFHAGLHSMFPLIREAVARLIDPSTIRHIGFSHLESDECGALNYWLELAPRA
jgi:flavorubredoxin